MRTHTNDFKQEINKMGRQIDGKIYYYKNFNLSVEDDAILLHDLILTENNLNLITEQIDTSRSFLISNEKILSMNLIKNGDILMSLMKEFDFETTVELSVGTLVNPHFGVLVNGNYEYLDYGNYFVKERKYNMDKETWSYVCYDKMLFSMIKYKPLDVEYPITIQDYLLAICDYLGLQFEYQTIEGITWHPDNFLSLVYSDMFKDRNVTFRDILDKIAEICGGNLLINDNDNISIHRLTPFPSVEPYVDTFDDKYLKDVKSNFDKKFGPVNQVSIIDTENNLEYITPVYFPSGTAKSDNPFKLEIKDNEFAFNGDTFNIATHLLLEIAGLEYYFCDFTTTGVCYLDYLDKFLITRKGVEYPCVLLNNEITIKNGIEEIIFADESSKTKLSSDEYTTSIMDSKETSFKVNKQTNEINSKVSKDGVISAINQSAEEIQIQANKIKLEGYTTINDGFQIDTYGNMIANNGTFSGLITAGKIKVSGYTEANPYISVGENWEDPTQPYGSYIWDTGISAIDYRSGHEPVIRTEGPSGGFAQLQGNHCDAFAFNNISLAEKKKDFELLKSGLEIVKNIDIYKYRYKNSNTAKKRIGLVIGKDFKYSKEITDERNTDVDLYSFISVCCRAIQEQQEEIDKLKEMIKNGKH